MAEKDMVMLRQKDLRRLHVMHKVLEGMMTQAEAAELVSLSERVPGNPLPQAKSASTTWK